MFFTETIRRYLVKRSTLDSINKAHEDLNGLIYKVLDLKSAHLQDLWVLSNFGSKKGFFVEFGAYDGAASSNTITLETDFDWTGIIAEPAIGMREQIRKNRRCQMDFRAVWDKSSEFIEFTEDLVEGYLSVAVQDKMINSGNKNHSYKVETVTLLDLLNQHNAPKIIDYVSIDVEGSELRILEHFFSNNKYYEINLWSVEHNFRKQSSDLLKMFQENGYRNVHRELSHRDFWFIKNDFNSSSES